MAKATFDITKIEIPTVAAKPLYASVGASDIAFTAVKEYVADVQQTVAGFDPRAARKQAAAVVADVQALPARVQNAVIDNVALASASFDDLAKRGQTVVTRVRKQNPTVGVQVKTTKTKVSASASATTTPVRKAPARKAPTKKATVQKSAARKAAAHKPAATRPAAKKA